MTKLTKQEQAEALLALHKGPRRDLHDYWNENRLETWRVDALHANGFEIVKKGGDDVV